jgi:hypothetical protein
MRIGLSLKNKTWYRSHFARAQSAKSILLNSIALAGFAQRKSQVICSRKPEMGISGTALLVSGRLGIFAHNH